MWGKRAVDTPTCIESCGEAAATEALESDWQGQLVRIGNRAESTQTRVRRTCGPPATPRALRAELEAGDCLIRDTSTGGPCRGSRGLKLDRVAVSAMHDPDADHVGCFPSTRRHVDHVKSCRHAIHRRGGLSNSVPGDPGRRARTSGVRLDA